VAKIGVVNRVAARRAGARFRIVPESGILKGNQLDPGPPNEPPAMSRPLPRAAPEVQLFTDGGCSGNPGPGGWAFLLRHVASGKELKRSGAERETTNNRMELLAVIRGLEALKRPTSVEVVTDSVYVGRGLTQWLPRWKANGWRRHAGRQQADIKNEDLWRRLDQLLADHRIQFTHVRGHAGHPENELCDAMAVEAYQRYL
jgi:ribonuclease HI